MQMQYMDVSAKPAAGGIDSYSSRGKLSEDNVEDALNMDVDASGRWSKRPGYETHLGWMPLRARRFIQDGTSIRVHFDSSQIINLSTVDVGPVIMHGKLPQLASYGSGSYSDTPASVYFDTFRLINRDTLTPGTHTLTKSAADTGVTSKYVYVGLAQATSQGSSSNEILLPGLVKIDTSTYQIDVEYTASAQASGYLYYKEKAAEAGVTYVASWPGGTTATIPAATHGLSNTRLSIKVFEEDSGTATEVMPAEAYIAQDGGVTITLSEDITGFVILSTVNLDNYYAAPATAGINTISVAAPPSPLCFYYIYYYDNVTGRRYQTLPALIAYDEATNTTNITYELAASSETVEIYWEEGVSIANIIELTDPAGSATIDTTEGSFTVWGIGHEGIYTTSSIRGGHVHHIDTYKSALEEHLVAGVNGCLYYGAPYQDAPSGFLMDTKYVALQARVDGEHILGPLFATADMGRTRGNVVDASVEDGCVTATDVEYVSEGVVNVTLAFVSKTGNIADCVSADDLLTVTGMADSRNNGSFPIISVVSEDATSAVLQISNSLAFDDTIEEEGSLGKAGVFTDQLSFTAYHRFLTGDALYAEGVSEHNVTAVTADDTVTLGDVRETTTLSSNLLVTGRRTGRILPLRGADANLTVENIVRGDSLSIDGITQKPVVLGVQTEADVAATFVTLSGITTVTLAAGRVVNQGRYVLLFGDTTDTYNGEWLVESAPSGTTFTILTPNIADGSGSGKMLGKCVELDESLTFADSFQSTPVRPVGRWLPIEAPTRGSSSVIADTSALQFDANSYSNQPNTASVVVADSMFFATADNPILKYDGSSIMQAGLKRLIPSVFMALDTSVPSILKGYDVAYTDVDAGGKTFTIGVDAFHIGDRIYDSTTETIFTIVDKQQDLANETWKLVVAGDTSGLTGTGTLTRVKRLRYYMRFTLIDRNNNILVSNAANSSDMYFDLVESGRVRIKASSYPPQGFQDYARLEVELYKTLSNSPAPFYLVKRLAVDMNYSGLTSLEFIDDVDDEYLSELDAVSSALLQTEIGVGWQPPYRAKAITTLSNRLITANLKSWPRWDITMKPRGVASTINDIHLFNMLFRKDSGDTSSEPDFINRIGFEFTNASTYAIGKAIPGLEFTSLDVDAGDDSITKTGADMVNGTPIKFVGNDLPAPLVENTIYYACRQSNSKFRIALTLEDALNNNSIDLTDVGSGNMTLIAAGELYDGKLLRGNSLNTGDWIYVFYSEPVANASLAYTGWFQVSVDPVTDVATLLGWGRGEQAFGAPLPDVYVIGNNGNIPVWVGTDYNYNQVNGNSAGSIELIAARRLADAINFVMSYSRYLDKKAFPTFQPWLTAYAGSDYNIGQIIVETQLPLATTPELVVGTLPTDMSVFVNNLSRTSDEQIGASTLLYPSRVALSYPNYPELFDRLDGTTTTSDSVVDINPADGQEIKAVVPFFGESTFGSAQLDQALIVFKERSIYALDPITRDYKRIDSGGRGCAAPFSVTGGVNGVFFASLGGIYHIDRSLSIKHIGKPMTGLWEKLVNKEALGAASATHWGEERQYKLSLPANGQDTNSAVFVMQYDRMADGLPPAWTRYDNIPATMWANMGSGSYFGSTEGIVFQTRQYGAPIDYRDNTEAITSHVIFRAEDFGLPGVRKVVPAVVIELDAGAGDVSEISVKTATNLSETFVEAASIAVDSGAAPVIKCSVADKKATRLQVKVEHSVKDEEFSVVGLNYRVGRLGIEGVSQAKSFES